MHDTVPALFQEAVAHHGLKPALRIKRDGQWVGPTFDALADDVEACARGLLVRGVRPGDRVAVLAPNAPEWQVADLGAMHAGAVTVPLYWSARGDETAAVLADAAPRVLIVHDAERARALAADAEAAGVERVVVIHPDAEWDGETLESLQAAGRAHETAHPDAFEDAWRAVRPRSPATIIYTAGATDTLRGAVLTHGALTYNAQQARDLLDLRSRDVTLMFLPLAHVFERIAELTGLAAGVTGYYTESARSLMTDIQDVRPTVLYAVPRVFEGLRDRVMREVAASNPAHRRFFEWALETGDRAAHYREHGWLVPPWLGVEEGVARALAFRSIRNRLGGRMRFFVSGGSPLNPDAARFFFAAGVPVYEGYGIPEAGPVVTLNWPLCYRLGSVGKPLPGTDVRISADGEVLARGPGLMTGYWNDPEATGRVLDAKGWLHTGELGEMDEEGFLHVLGRKRNVITLTSGTRVAPLPMEKRLEESPFIEQAVVFGEGRPHVVAVLVPDLERLRRDLHWKDASRAALARHPAVRMILREEVAVANENVPEGQQVRDFVVRGEPFTVETGELTPTLKVRRNLVRDFHASDLEDLYDEALPPEKK